MARGEKPPSAKRSGAGDRRTVVGLEGPVFAGLEFGGFFDVPKRVSINKSASYGFPWNRIGNFLTLLINTIRKNAYF